MDQGYSSMVGAQSSMCEALGSNANTAQKKMISFTQSWRLKIKINVPPGWSLLRLWVVSYLLDQTDFLHPANEKREKNPWSLLLFLQEPGKVFVILLRFSPSI